VKRAKLRTTGERFAVKVLSKRKMSEEDLAALHTEIEILKSVDHPNIVKLIDIFEDERHVCLVMELLLGGELFDQIIEKDKFSEYDAREATKAIIDAISYCHSLGIIHRDIKPENLLLHSKDQGIGSLKIADFGLARCLDQNQLASTTCGTPGYVAPEVLQQQPYGMECDYWSIGVVTYIMLSGTPPFYDEDNFQLFEMIKNCQYDFEDDTWKYVSEQAKAFVSEILVKDPKTRLNLEGMKNHPWFKLELNQENFFPDESALKNKLFKYVSVRNEGR
jgi:calcium/calmodulin-dependent protein kinase I